MQKIVTVVIANDETGVAYFEDDILTLKFRIHTNRARTKDEYEMMFHYFFSSIHSIDRCIIGSVVPEVTNVFKSAVQTYFQCDVVTVGPGVKTGINLQNASPKEIGADRIINAAGAYHMFEKKVIVVCFGTAVTFDYVDENGVLKYTVIAPGIETAMNALKTKAAKLPTVSLEKARSVLGKDTTSGMQAGIYYGFQGLVENILEKIQNEVGDCHVVACGKNADYINTNSIHKIEQDLPFFGLKYIASLNEK